MQAFLTIFVVIALTAFGQLVVKARAIAHTQRGYDNQLAYLFAMLTDVWVISGLVAAVLASICWMLAIQKLELGFAYPFVALGFVLVPVASFYLFKEPLPLMQMVGLGLIVVGVAVSSVSRY